MSAKAGGIISSIGAAVATIYPPAGALIGVTGAVVSGAGGKPVASTAASSCDAVETLRRAGLKVPDTMQAACNQSLTYQPSSASEGIPGILPEDPASAGTSSSWLPYAVIGAGLFAAAGILYVRSRR